MSIIITKIENNECLFLSDTKVSIDNGDKTVTGGNKIRLAASEGVLKVNIVKPKICIAYAGDIEPATNIIQSFVIKKPKELKDILEFFKKEINRIKCDVEFIIGIIHDNGLPQLYKISGINIEIGKSFWIGNKNAFNEFQHYFINSKNKESIIENATESFRNLINDTKIETIGDFNISASYNRKLKTFIYDWRMEGYGGYNKLYVEKDKPIVLTEGSVEEGAFIVNNLISNNIRKPAVCLYFTKGEIGFLFIPISETNNNVNPIIRKGKLKSFIENVKLEFDIQLTGMDFNNGVFNFKI